MNTRLLLILFALSSALSAAPPPELTVLRQQYEKALAERVTAPFDANKTVLDAKFTTALDAALAEAQKTGKLDDVLAIEDDRKRITGKQPLPDTDDAKTPEPLKKLRAIYREQIKKLDDQRGTSHTALLAGYTVKLQDLETTLTKAGRIDEAKELRDYRTALSTASAPIADTKPVPPATVPVPPPAVPSSSKAARIHSRLANSRWTTTNWDDAVITLQADGKVRFSRGGHTVTWEVGKTGELLFSDRGTAPRRASLEANLDKFILSMGGDHECTRLDATNLQASDGVCSKELNLAKEGHVMNWKPGESIAWSQLSLEPGSYEIVLLTHGFRSCLYQFKFKTGADESTVDFDPTSGGWGKAKETSVGRLTLSARAEKLEAVCAEVKPPIVPPNDPKESTFGLRTLILVRLSSRTTK